MSKYVDKMNLPQHKYFNNMIGRDEEIHELVSDTLTGELVLKRGDKKSRSEAFLLLSKARQRIAGFLYCPAGRAAGAPAGQSVMKWSHTPGRGITGPTKVEKPYMSKPLLSIRKCIRASSQPTESISRMSGIYRIRISLPEIYLRRE